jgi:hypothetical protein
LTAELIVSILRNTPDRLSGMTGGLTEARLRAALEPGEVVKTVRTLPD